MGFKGTRAVAFIGRRDRHGVRAKGRPGERGATGLGLNQSPGRARRREDGPDRWGPPVGGREEGGANWAGKRSLGRVLAGTRNRLLFGLRGKESKKKRGWGLGRLG